MHYYVTCCYIICNKRSHLYMKHTVAKSDCFCSPFEIPLMMIMSINVSSDGGFKSL